MNQANFIYILYLLVNKVSDIDISKYIFSKLIEGRDQYGRCVPRSDLQYFYFYLLPKIHKTPIQYRPVMSSVNSVPESLSQ